jgi:hypothetical protein
MQFSQGSSRSVANFLHASGRAEALAQSTPPG